MEILKLLYRMGVIPYDKKRDASPEWREVMEEEKELIRHWREKLPEREREELERLIAAMGISCFYKRQHEFISGFQLGSLLMLEILSARERFLQEVE